MYCTVGMTVVQLDCWWWVPGILLCHGGFKSKKWWPWQRQQQERRWCVCQLCQKTVRPLEVLTVNRQEFHHPRRTFAFIPPLSLSRYARIISLSVSLLAKTGFRSCVVESCRDDGRRLERWWTYEAGRSWNPTFCGVWVGGWMRNAKLELTDGHTYFGVSRPLRVQGWVRFRNRRWRVSKWSKAHKETRCLMPWFQIFQTFTFTHTHTHKQYTSRKRFQRLFTVFNLD